VLLYLLLYLHFSSPFLHPIPQAPLSQYALTHVESIFEFGGRAASHGRWLDITRILEHLRTFLEFDPRIPEVAPKIPRLPPDPLLVGAHPLYELPPIGIREIRSINNQESDKKFNVESIKLFYIKYKCQVIFTFHLGRYIIIYCHFFSLMTKSLLNTDLNRDIIDII